MREKLPESCLWVVWYLGTSIILSFRDGPERQWGGKIFPKGTVMSNAPGHSSVWKEKWPAMRI
jgi:hypothetical protein